MDRAIGVGLLDDWSTCIWLISVEETSLLLRWLRGEGHLECISLGDVITVQALTVSLVQLGVVIF